MTRRQGKDLRSKLFEEYHRMCDGDSLVIDFEKLDIMTPSFADECIGKLAELVGVEKFTTRIVMLNANPIVRTLINSILSERLHPDEHPDG